jgi:hypothetical protein
MARKARGTGADKEQELELLKALRFINVAQNPAGQAAYQKHCRFSQNQVIAFDGILSAGYPVQEQMDGCPNTELLIDALAHVRGAYSLTLLDTLSLVVVSGDYRGLVPCLRPVEIEHVVNDPPNYELNDGWKLAALEAGSFCTDNATTVMGASVLTQEYSVLGTNGMALIERATGCHTPAGLVVPMAFVKAVAKTDLKLQRFGFSQGSLTFYFENGAWIRTQLYQEAYPDLSGMFRMMEAATATEVPEALFTAVKAVQKFSETGVIWIDRDQVRSHETTDIGAQHRCADLPFTTKVNAKNLMTCQPFFKRADFTGNDNAVVFFGEQVRGLLAKSR